MQLSSTSEARARKGDPKEETIVHGMKEKESKASSTGTSRLVHRCVVTDREQRMRWCRCSSTCTKMATTR
eukprot:766227-Hanusia_phi.AAC.4